MKNTDLAVLHTVSRRKLLCDKNGISGVKVMKIIILVLRVRKQIYMCYQMIPKSYTSEVGFDIPCHLLSNNLLVSGLGIHKVTSPHCHYLLI